MWDERYRQLEAGEIIQPGDEVDISNKWQHTKCTGELAPNPEYPAHRIYRRLKTIPCTEYEKSCNQCSLEKDASCSFIARPEDVFCGKCTHYDWYYVNEKCHHPTLIKPRKPSKKDIKNNWQPKWCPRLKEEV